MFTRDERKRFWEKARIGDSCWEWTACKNAGGYGQYFFEGRLQVASRVAYKLTHGSLAKGLHVCHTCNNPACIRPSHLFRPTQKRSMEECVTKGRIGSKPSDQTREIVKRLYEGEKQSDLAREYGLSRQRIGQIKHRWDE
jgi:hypothetical protein